MRSIKPISTTIDIQEDFYNKTKKNKPDIILRTYIEENSSKFITINITSDSSYEDEFNLWLDIDICQAELLAKKLQLLIDDRKKYMLEFLNITE